MIFSNRKDFSTDELISYLNQISKENLRMVAMRWVEIFRPEHSESETIFHDVVIRSFGTTAFEIHEAGGGAVSDFKISRKMAYTRIADFSSLRVSLYDGSVTFRQLIGNRMEMWLFMIYKSQPDISLIPWDNKSHTYLPELDMYND